MDDTLSWKQHHLHSIYMRVYSECGAKRSRFFLLLGTWNEKATNKNYRVLCDLSRIPGCVSIWNSATALQYCAALAKETGSLTHSEHEDREAAFCRHYGCDSELGTKCPLSNSLEILKRHSHTNTVRRKYSQLVEMSPHILHTHQHKGTHTVWARRSCRDRNAVQPSSECVNITAPSDKLHCHVDTCMHTTMSTCTEIDYKKQYPTHSTRCVCSPLLCF